MPPPRPAPQPHRRPGIAAAAAAAAGRPGAGPQRRGSGTSCASLAAPCRPQPLQGPGPGRGWQGMFLCPRNVFPSTERKALPAIVLVRWKGGKARLTPGNNSFCGGRGCRRHRHWRGCCCRCHSAQSGRSYRRGRQPSAGGPSWRSRSRGPGGSAAPAAASWRERRGAWADRSTEGAAGRGRRESQGKKEGERTGAGAPTASTPARELQCTWRGEICLDGYTTKKNHHPTGFRMTNNRLWNSSSPKESNASSSGMFFLAYIYLRKASVFIIYF